MINLIEIVFEQISKSCVVQLLFMLINRSGKIQDVQCSEQLHLLVDGELSAEALNDLVDFNDDVSLIVSIAELRLGDICLPNVHLRLVKYGNEFDIDFNFDSNELENTNMTNFINSLHTEIQNISSNFDVTCFYGGVEPASDEDNRYFTDDKSGPLVY